MWIQLCIEILVALIGVYYVTIFMHLMGVTLFKKAEISLGLALIPFYYWFKRETTV